MIHRLQIHDFAALHQLELTFGPGLNVLSGASGQGKSTVLDALRFVCGLGRSKGLGRLVRRGAKRARVELTFSLDPARLKGLSPRWSQSSHAGQITVVRSVDSRGRSRAQLASQSGEAPQPLQLTELREVGQRLAEVYGQGSAPRLVDEAVQRNLLDGASRLHAARERFAAGRQKLVELARQRDALARTLQQRVAEEEAAVDTLACLEELDPEAGEHDALLEQEEALSEVSAWWDALNELGGLFAGPGADWIQRLERVAGKIEADPDDPVFEPLTEGLNLLERSRGALEERLESLRDQRGTLEDVEVRLRAYRSAARRLGTTPGELATRWANLQNAPSVAQLGLELRRLDRALAEHWSVVLGAGNRLSKSRIRAARKLEKAVAPRLSELGLERGRFRIRVQPAEVAAPSWTHFSPQSVHPKGAPSPKGAVVEVEQRLPTAHGLDLTAFEFSPDSAVELAPLAQASGGELSRLFLALGERAAGDAPVLVFDEIDQNLGARLGTQVGACLADLGQARQVLVVTHLAPVAARARLHLRIQRRKGAIVAEALQGKARVEELALMIRGEPITAAARRQAEELLREAPAPDEAPARPTAELKRGAERQRRRRRRTAKSA